MSEAWIMPGERFYVCPYAYPQIGLIEATDGPCKNYKPTK